MPSEDKKTGEKEKGRREEGENWPEQGGRTHGVIPRGRRLTDDRVLIITIVLVHGLILRNFLIVAGEALCSTKNSATRTPNKGSK